MVSEESVKRVAQVLLSGFDPRITPNTLSVEYAKRLRELLPEMVEDELVKLIREVAEEARKRKPSFGELWEEHLTLWTTRRRNRKYERSFVHITIRGPRLLARTFKLLTAYSLRKTKRPLSALTLAYAALRTLLGAERGSIQSGAGLLRKVSIFTDDRGDVRKWDPPSVIEEAVRRNATEMLLELCEKAGLDLRGKIERVLSKSRGAPS